MILSFKHHFSQGLDGLSKELNTFHHEAEIWKVTGDISNSAGTLALHLVGNLNHFIGAQLGKTGYVREREKEFSTRDLQRDVLLHMVAETKTMLEKTFGDLTDADLAKAYPLPNFGEGKDTGYVLLLLLGHFNYHLGQINYLRRFFSPTAL